MIDSRDIWLKQIEDDVWEFSVDSEIYFIRDNYSYDGMYFVSRENTSASQKSDDGSFYDSVFVARFDNPFEAIKFILNQII